MHPFCTPVKASDQAHLGPGKENVGQHPIAFPASAPPWVGHSSGPHPVAPSPLRTWLGGPPTPGASPSLAAHAPLGRAAPRPPDAQACPPHRTGEKQGWTGGMGGEDGGDDAEEAFLLAAAQTIEGGLYPAQPSTPSALCAHADPQARTLFRAPHPNTPARAPGAMPSPSPARGFTRGACFSGGGAVQAGGRGAGQEGGNDDDAAMVAACDMVERSIFNGKCSANTPCVSRGKFSSHTPTGARGVSGGGVREGSFGGRCSWSNLPSPGGYALAPAAQGNTHTPRGSVPAGARAGGGGGGGFPGGSDASRSVQNSGGGQNVQNDGGRVTEECGGDEGGDGDDAWMVEAMEQHERSHPKPCERSHPKPCERSNPKPSAVPRAAPAPSARAPKTAPLKTGGATDPSMDKVWPNLKPSTLNTTP